MLLSLVDRFEFTNHEAATLRATRRLPVCQLELAARLLLYFFYSCSRLPYNYSRHLTRYREVQVQLVYVQHDWRSLWHARHSWHAWSVKLWLRLWRRQATGSSTAVRAEYDLQTLH